MDKRSLKREYKEADRPAGVYRVQNTVNGRSLVGSSINVQAMLNRHRAALKMGAHENREMQQEWGEVGEAGFAFEVLDTVKRRDEPGQDVARELRTLEELWLERLAPYGAQGYNAPPKPGDGSPR